MEKNKVAHKEMHVALFILTNIHQKQRRCGSCDGKKVEEKMTENDEWG